MSTESLLSTLIKYDRFHGANQMVPGIAQLAVDKGYENLSGKQKLVLEPYLTHACDGVTDPGEHHNNCQHILEGDELESAIQNDMHYGGLLCPSCVDEKEDYRRRWEDMQSE